MPESLPTPIDLKDGKERALKLGSFAICRFEEEYGEPVEGIIREEMTQRFVRALIWAGLLWQEPGLTLPAVDAMLDHYREATGMTRSESRNALSGPLLETCIQAGIFRRVEPAKNGHDPNVLTEKGEVLGSSPTGTGT